MVSKQSSPLKMLESITIEQEEGYQNEISVKPQQTPNETKISMKKINNRKRSQKINILQMKQLRN